MLGQGEIGVLSTQDLKDWRDIEGELAAIDQCPEKWSQNDIRLLHIKRLVMMSCLYDTYRLDYAKEYEFNPLNGVITEAPVDVTISPEDEA